MGILPHLFTRCAFLRKVNTPYQRVATFIWLPVIKAMKEEEFKARLRTLKKELARNEELMQEAAISYEDLVAEKEALQSAMENLRKSRAAEIRQGELSSP